MKKRTLILIITALALAVLYGVYAWRACTFPFEKGLWDGINASTGMKTGGEVCSLFKRWNDFR